jgi:hypothetical protein
MNRILIASLFLLAGAAHAAGWSAPLTIDRAFTEDSDMLVIYTVEGGVYTTGCLANTWIFRASSETRRARAWATILTAQATGQKVQLWFSDQCSTWSYHDTTAIMLHKP